MEGLKMCKKITVAYADYIGSRLVSWICWNGKDYSFVSDKAVKSRIKEGNLVNGLALDEENNVVIDQEFTKSLMGKSGLCFNPIVAAESEDEPVMNKYYALVKVVKGKDSTNYHFITNRCGYEVFTEEQVKAMLAILDMGGIKLGADGTLVIHKAVDVEDTTGDQNRPQRTSKNGKEAV